MSVAEHWGRTAVVELLRAHGADDPVDRATAQVRALWDEIGDWFAVHAPPCAEQLRAGTGASPAAVQALAVAVGHHLPVDLRAHFQLYGGNGGGMFFEYAGLSVDAALGRWRDLAELRRQGTFDGWAPGELDTEEELVEPVWWSPAWLPFAEDSGGNLYCVDLAPARRGVRGQVIAWEVHGGPVGPMASSFEAYLSRYRDQFRSGRYRYDLDSGIFDDAD
ncbi:cell wall assembly regulator SMI1 [Micromonospora sp. A200]|uniref:SMI1/KNR4 family protein n=1 Tax=Micromonospora sp. A200 TaxID=2940568 RepID=UPI002474E7B4|nr:SMI1/KNR4 family protein [Micromonospora sp. A200]MDH6464157.1 cell wall assembly regulator SMI1 [Micromonospora sp. A200]